MMSRRIDEELECPICLDRFEVPKVLPCQHTFCAHCLDELNERGRVSCPECRAVFPVPASGFPINITMQRLLSASETQNNPTLNVPTSEPVINTPLQPSAPPIGPPPARLPPVYPPQNPIQPTPNHFALYDQPPRQIYADNFPAYEQRPSENGTPLAFIGRPQPAHVPQHQPLPRIHTQDNRNQQPYSGGYQEPRLIQSENDSDGNNFERCKTVFLKYFSITRNAVRKMISNFLKKYKSFMAVTTVIFLIITFSRFVAGAVKLYSDCPDERRVAQYLFVKSIFGFLFWGIMLLLGCKKKLATAMDNRFVEVYLVLESVFSLIWLIIGTVWTMGNRDEMIEECPFHVNDWNKHFINFALFLTSIDWIGLVAFGFYCCYVQFDRSDDDDNT